MGNFNWIDKILATASVYIGDNSPIAEVITFYVQLLGRGGKTFSSQRLCIFIDVDNNDEPTVVYKIYTFLLGKVTIHQSSFAEFFGESIFFKFLWWFCVQYLHTSC